jgi:hypothetical protein
MLLRKYILLLILAIVFSVGSAGAHSFHFLQSLSSDFVRRVEGLKRRIRLAIKCRSRFKMICG